VKKTEIKFFLILAGFKQNWFNKKQKFWYEQILLKKFGVNKLM